MFRNLFILALLSLTVIELQAQSTIQGIEKDLEIYEQYIKTGDYDTMMDYVNPKLFDVVPRDMLASVFQEMFEGDENLIITIGDIVVDNILDIQKIEGKYYSFIDYTMDMEMVMAGEEVDSETLDLTANLLEMQFGEGNVTVDEDRNAILVISQTAMIAEYVTDKWTFVQYDTGQQGLLDMLIEKPVLEKILNARFSNSQELDSN